jgi:hypothetical protein
MLEKGTSLFVGDTLIKQQMMMSLATILLLFMMGAISVINCDNDPAQVKALIDIFQKTNGDGWIRKNNWNTEESYCVWFGVQCDTKSQNVTGLYLAGNNLRGSLSASVGYLQSLQYLDLRNNSMSGYLPIELSQLPALTWLILQNNKFDSQLPPLGQGTAYLTKL